jgi:hypothetical protein
VTTAVVTLAAPFVFLLVRLLATSRHVYLIDDLAMIDLHVRDALHFQQQLGQSAGAPPGGFGWNHPGPVCFYLLSLPARVLGSGAPAEFVGATLINVTSVLVTLWVVRRRAGPRAALWSAVCLGFLAFVLDFQNGEAPFGVPTSPWNAYVVIFPMVLFVVLCAASTASSPLSLLGAVLVGSIAVQTDFSTFPLVAVLLVAATAIVIGQAVSSHRHRHRDGPRPRRTLPKSLIPGLGLLGIVWLPPLIEQFSNNPGNMTLIWRFFTAHHQPRTLGSGLWSTLAVDALLDPVQHHSSFFFAVLGHPPRNSLVILTGVLLVGVSAIVLGARWQMPFATTLGLLSLVGFAVVIVSVTRIVGPIHGYRVVFEIVLPVAALVGVGVALLGMDAASVQSRRRPPNPHSESASQSVLGVLVVLAVLGALLHAARIDDEPSLQSHSFNELATVWKDVSAHLQPSSHHVYVANVASSTVWGSAIFLGLFDELQAQGYHPRVSRIYEHLVGPRYVSSGDEPIRVALYGPSTSIERMPGYVGHTRDVDIVITTPVALR